MIAHRGSRTALHGNGMNKAPSNRSFCWTFTVFFALAGAWSAWSDGIGFVFELPLAAVFAGVTLFRPDSLSQLNRGWMKVAEVLNVVVSPVVLAVMFYGVFTPAGYLMRLAGKDPMRRKYEPGSSSYWIERTPPGPEPESLSEQF